MIITLHSLDNEMLKTETMKYIQSQNLILFNLSNAATCNYKECKLVSHCGTNFYKHIYYTLDSTFVRHTCGICLFSITFGQMFDHGDDDMTVTMATTISEMCNQRDSSSVEGNTTLLLWAKLQTRF